jgi:hypothetical protein
MKASCAKQDSKPSPGNLVKEFRAYLHLVITAGQLGRSKELEALPGAEMAAYCRALAEQPGNTLARELAEPVRAILKLINDVTIHFYRPIYQKKVKDAAEQAELENILEQLDFALALIMRHLPGMVRHRVHLTRSCDLLVETIREMIIGRAGGIERVLRHHKELFPDEYEQPEVNFHSDSNYLFQFAWDTYERIEVLGRLADEFPEHIRAAARRMHGWPMLAHRHTHNRREFNKLARKLELGEDYPTDVSEAARFRPDTPLVRYLDPLIRRIHIVCEELGDIELKTTEDERSMLLHLWWWRLEESPSDEELAALRAARTLPALTKTTAIEWAEKALVPLILARDALDWKNCKEPVLQRIAKQRGVKSRATFKSRLLAAVAATLRRLARPA